jgi:Sulfatase
MGNDLTRREFLNAGVTTSAMLARARVGQPAAVPRPNILFILADDLGYGDLSCYGRPDYRTPVVDTLAGEGMKFMSAYAAAPVCTPTRCALATGRYPQRLEVGLYEPLTGRDLDKGLPVCQGKPARADRLLFWRTQTRDAARMGNWKYLKESGNEHLFDLAIDSGEKNDLRAAHAEVSDRIRTRYRDWNAQMLPRLDRS